jgi:signal transduction histidine kinase/ActR/RegA family two-component response regulator
VRFVPLPRIGSDAGDVLILISDETEQVAIQTFLRVELEVAAILSQSASIGAVRCRLLSAICQGLHWEAAELWEADEEGTRWLRTAGWQAGAPETLCDEEPSREALLSIDEGLPGLARRMRDVIWGADVPHREPLRAQSAALEASGHDFVAIPILLGGTVRAVLVFYGVDAASAGARLHDLIAFIADQVAQALAREQMSTTLHETEETLRQTRKMEAIGRLAGGIAHDFNNLLTVILGNCELLQDKVALQPRIGEFVEEIRTASDRAAQLTRQLLTFSRKRPSKADVVNLNEVLRDFERMLQRVVGAAITVDMRLDPTAHPVRLDRVEFEQVMLNLAANARDAMPGGGRLTISTTNVWLELKAVASFSDVKPGDFVELCVSDTGCGMDEQTRSRVFQPFFTTKGVGRGTGLGLATVYGIICNGHGFVRVESQPGAGARFLIYLPRAPLGIAPRDVDAQPADDPRGSETVLVVEDEDVLRNLVQRILVVHGYTVFSASNGREALDLLRDGARGAHLLLTDIVMPQMTGLQLSEEARNLHPELPTLFMSGYPDLADPTGSHIPRGADLLCKPFTSDALARAVRQALDRSRGRAPSIAAQVPVHCGPAASSGGSPCA